MGKVSRWFKSLFGMKKEKKKEHVVEVQKRWPFAKKGKSTIDSNITENQQSKHAILVAAATSAAAHAAVAAAQATVAVVRLTSQSQVRGTLFSGSRQKWGAVKIQTSFRGYLARKALRALKGCVKIQALVRGYLVRKRAAATLHSMHALVRPQNSVRTHRARRSMSKENRFLSENIARKSMERFDETMCEFHSKRLPTSYETPLNGFDESPETVEIDTFSTMSEYGEELPPCHAIMSPPLRTRISVPDYRNHQQQQDFDWYFNNVEECRYPTTHNPPCCNHSSYQPYYYYFPNYMAKTQSFKAKIRSHCAPKQRTEVKKRLSLNEIIAARNRLSSVRMQKPPSSNLQTQKNKNKNLGIF